MTSILEDTFDQGSRDEAAAMLRATAEIGRSELW